MKKLAAVLATTLLAAGAFAADAPSAKPEAVAAVPAQASMKAATHKNHLHAHAKKAGKSAHPAAAH